MVHLATRRQLCTEHPVHKRKRPFRELSYGRQAKARPNTAPGRRTRQGGFSQLLAACALSLIPPSGRVTARRIIWVAGVTYRKRRWGLCICSVVDFGGLRQRLAHVAMELFGIA